MPSRLDNPRSPGSIPGRSTECKTPGQCNRAFCPNRLDNLILSVPAVTTRNNWVRVSRSSPCSICKEPDWCSVSADGALAKCMRVAEGCWRLRHRPDRCPLPLAPPRQSNLAERGPATEATWTRGPAGRRRGATSRLLGPVATANPLGGTPGSPPAARAERRRN